MLWDPLNAWPKGRRWLWAALAVLACLMQGPTFLRNLRPPRDGWTDFFQEWAAARNYSCGLPIYADPRITVERHLGHHSDNEDDNFDGHLTVSKVFWVNAHPPTSVLLALPLAALDYPDAVLVWNLLSLGALFLSFWIIRRELAIPFSGWSVFPLVALLLICNPFRQQMIEGQLTLLLLLLLTGCWAAQRGNRTGWAGVLLGTAVAIKLFPGILFIYFALQRQWKAVMSGTITLAVITVLLISMLGVETYKSYGMDVVPRVAVFRASWFNASLPGLWTKLFDPDTEGDRVHPEHIRIEPLWRSLTLARLSTWVSCGVVVTVLAWIVWRARSRIERDLAFGLTIIAMLLVSPITWDHYLLLLTIPLAVTWTQLPRSNLVRLLFLIILVALWMEPVRLFDAVIVGGYQHGIAYPIHTLCVLSIPCYVLLSLFALNVAMSLTKFVAEESRPPAGIRTPPELSPTSARELQEREQCFGIL
jgi:hypothetical protein